MRKLRFLSFLLFTILCLNSCWDDKDDVCEDETLPVENLENLYGCTNTPHQMEIELQEDFTLIQTQADFDTMVSGSCTPEIDFETYDLVIGKKALPNGAQMLNYNLERLCISETLVLEVQIILNETTVAPNITYHALIPKLQEGQNIEVEISIE